MQHTRGLLTLAIILSFILTGTVTALSQDSRVALQRGYRTGYSDGYMAGYRDVIDGAAKEFGRHSDYREAKRAYNADYGPAEDYSDGYRQGFEAGYEAGFDKRSFDSTLPGGLAKRGNTPAPVTPVAEIKTAPTAAADPVEMPETEAAVSAETATEAETEETPVAEAEPVTRSAIQKVAYTAGTDDPIIIIPRDTELVIEIQEPLSTETNRMGDRFTAKVTSPWEIEGAIIEGRVERITKPGRIKRRAEMLLTFDRIVINDSRWSNFSAIVTEVLPVRGDNIKMVDTEGTAIGKSSVKSDSIRIGTSTGVGLGIGALTAGPVGAAVGAGVGAAFGVGSMVVERGKHIEINQNQQMRVRTAYETKIR